MKKIFSLLLVIVLGFSLVACSSSSTKNVQGMYELVEIVSDTHAMTTEELDKLKEDNLVVTLELKEDGSGTMNVFGDNQNISYNAEEEYIEFGGERLKYTYDGVKFVIAQADESLVFLKSVE